MSFYLDYYPDYWDESAMKVMRYESLGISIYAKPRSQREKDYNDRMREATEALRFRRYGFIVNERHVFFDREKDERWIPCLLYKKLFIMLISIQIKRTFMHVFTHICIFFGS